VSEGYVFDIETNGLLPELHTIHCISLQLVDLDGRELGPVLSSNRVNGELTIEQALDELSNADFIVGHNIMGFDIPAIRKLYPRWTYKRAIDTIILSTLIYPDIRDRDFNLVKRKPGQLPGQMIGRHSLEAWGYRLGHWKGDYSAMMKALGLDPWAAWSQEMDDYCDQDVVVCRALFELQMSKGLSQEAIDLEHAVAPILARQEAYGFLFDQQLASHLERELLTKRQEIADKLAAVFPPWKVLDKSGISKVNNKKLGRVKGQPYETFKTVVFNPGSRDHIAYVLQQKYGWKPREFTPEGKPKVDEDVLSRLKYPEVPLLLEYLLVAKRFGQLASPPPKMKKDGTPSKAKKTSEAWIDHLKADGRIHGRVNQNGAVTGRMTHSNPNIAQVPKVQHDKVKGILKGLEGGWGYECRSLFTVPKGKKLVGADASGLELRCLAHFMAMYDGGAYAKVLLEGDIHTENQNAAGLPSRDNAKTFIYAFLYGAGDEKIGSIIGKGRKHGKELKQRFLTGLPALAKLVRAVKKKAKEQGWLRGLDGRRLHIRSDHAALNTLLQSAGALVMKKALVLLDWSIQEKGLVPGVNYEFVANVHDEWQIEVDEEHAEMVGQLAKAAIRRAGDSFGFRCPLDGEFKVGNNWAETH